MQKQSIERFFSRIDELRKTYLSSQELPTIAIMGPYNTGKSTLINNLLGQETISPVDIIPATPAPISFRFGERFLGRAYFAKREVNTLTIPELTDLLLNKKLSEQKLHKVDIWFKHELLQKMCLIDTPGIDAAINPITSQNNLSEVDHIVYLLHQRGPGEADRKMIQELVKHHGAGNISFWINCNLGAYDNTSFQESYKVLREICTSEVPLYLTNTKESYMVDKLRLYIEDRAAYVIIKKVTNHLINLDFQIPDILTSSLDKSSDSDFMLNFWQAREQTLQVIGGQNMLKTLPPISQQIRDLLTQSSSGKTQSGGLSLVYKTRGRMPDPTAIRVKILSLIKRAMSDPVLISCTETIRQLRTIYSKLERENYLVTAVGSFSSGKSTFFNALMGEVLLPAENRPTTFNITLLKHGSHKKATITFAEQVTIPTYHREDNHAIICRHELAALEQWLNNPALIGKIESLKKSNNGKLSNISASELLQEIEQLKKYFAKVQRRFKTGKRPWKSLFKKIPLKKFTDSHLAEHYIVVFRNQEKLELNLQNKEGLATLAEIAGSHLALRVKHITIEHPATLLQLATFVDTPGLDSVYHRHHDITTQYLPISDCFLFFLNGKHILTKPDLSVFQMICKAMQNLPDSARKLFILINFSDTLTSREQERVYNYLHENLVRPSKGTIEPGNMYLISALEALSGIDKKSFFRLMQHLKDLIWETRCADNYLDIIQQTKNTLHDNNLHASLHSAISRYIDELTKLEENISSPGGISNAKRQSIR